ncbi:MAG: IPT/TIG domain-containing protein [Cyanosarcina radialis HA8281-LM2]|nr:IPT/TIG domain-containing protein [Cyanosarcina radialis HA8281-LM2]
MNITNIYPTSGVIGQGVKISGSGFSSKDLEVYFNGFSSSDQNLQDFTRSIA